jgi:uncharacterized protein YqgC (DUF456 family)
VIFDWILGTTLLVIGVIGSLLPVLQGWVFILAGLAVLSSHSRHAKAAMDWIKAKARSARERLGSRKDPS